ncbi:SDR family NAD(P)-dependent oxidoreductase [Chloroflexota bacterium]
MKLTDKVAIVTGSSRGIGKAIALELARQGANIVVAARTEADGRLPGTIHDTAKEIQALGKRALAIRTDVTKDEDIENMVKKAIDEFDHIDILVNNAGLSFLSPLLDLPVKHWDLVMSVNLRAPFICTKAVLPKMVEQMCGSIINVSSILGTRVLEGPIPYGVTKAALERFTLSLAEEVRRYNISVNAIAPGLTVTEGLKTVSTNADITEWQKPELWGKISAFIITQGPAFTGKVINEEMYRWKMSELS